MMGTKYLVADEVGLTKWADFKKPPYTTIEYEEAYNNGVNLAVAVEAAYNEGYSKVVIERGNYPLCYAMTSRHATYINPACHIQNVHNFEIDGNSSVFFTIYDSNNMSPYQTELAATYLAPYMLGGTQFGFSHTTNLNFHGFELRGDQYMRSWVAGEEVTEQTYGIKLMKDNIDIRIDCIAYGFRGDSVTSNNKGSNIASLTDNWEKGGLSATGAPVVEEGSYRTQKIDLSSTTIYRNAVQIMTTGYIAAAYFRDPRLGIFFFDSTGKFISQEWGYQACFIYLPVNCRYIQIVAYGDERTDDVVSYGTYLNLATGCDYGAVIDGEFFANMRGGVSNLCGNTVIKAHIHDIGTTKYGFPHYNDSTRYGVNFEDTFVDSLIVKGIISNSGSAILCNSRSLLIDGCYVNNMIYAGVASFGTIDVKVVNSTFMNTDTILESQGSHSFYKERTIQFSGNKVMNSKVLGSHAKSDGLMLSITDNDFIETDFVLTGNGKNIEFSGNRVRGHNSSTSRNTMYLLDLLMAHNNYIDSITPNNTINSICNLTADYASGNVLITYGSRKTLESINKPLNGVHYIANGSYFMLPITRETSVNKGSILKNSVNDCSFSGGSVWIGDPNTSVKLIDSEFIFKNCTFKGKEGVALLTLSLATKIGSRNEFTFLDCEFDLSDSDSVMTLLEKQLGDVKVQFLNCRFISNTKKDIYFFGNQYPRILGMNIEAVDCDFYNVKLLNHSAR